MTGDKRFPITRVSRQELHLSRYEKCLETAPGAPVYAWPWFLDIMAGKWEVLVWDDYRYVMPVAFRRKWGISYVYQPVFVQQLGIYPAAPPDETRAFFTLLASLYPYIHYPSGYGAEEAEAAGFTIMEHHTRRLRLGTGYPSLAARFGDYITQNLKKATLNQITVSREFQPAVFFELQKVSRKIPVPADAWNRFRRLMEATLSDGRGLLLVARDPGKEAVAAAYFILWRDTAYYMAVCSGPRGRALRAGFALLDTFFRDHGHLPITFDFEGSSVEGVDRFFAAFGAESSPYYLFRLNRLPWPIRRIKQ